MSGIARSVCPNCLNVRPCNEAACGHCRQPLEWIDSHPRLREALTPGSDQRWRSDLHLRVNSGDDEATVVRSAPGAFDLAVGLQGPLLCDVDASFDRLKVTASGSAHVLDIPCQTRIGSLDIEAQVRALPRRQESPMVISLYRPGPISFDFDAVKTLGKLQTCDVSIIGDGVAAEHCLVVAERLSVGGGTSIRYWIVDLGSSRGTFVNREQILCAPLEADDLVQIGPFAWTLHASGGQLVPVTEVKGVTLGLRDVERGGILRPTSLDIPAGQFLAVVGRSGSGKSTLLKAIVGVPGYRTQGNVLIDGQDTALDEAGFRSILGYVSQDSVIHLDLRSRQFLSFGGRLRKQGITPEQVEAVFKQVDFQPERWTAFPEELSGGQRKRLQAAAELITEPRLLLLDEPTSGLDPQRERSLLKLLRNVSHRGCTVVVVTHSLSRLEQFDRVLLVEAGRILFDGPPQQLLSRIPSGKLDDLDWTNPVDDFNPAPSRWTSSKKRWTDTPVRSKRWSDWLIRRVPDDCRQFWLLFRREWARFGNVAFRRLGRLCGVPLLFALALHLAVPATKTEQLGFLILLSVIWLGASQSLLSIADEREVFEHERLLFLRVVPYMAAKTCFLWILSLFQTLWLYAPLLALRAWDGRSGNMLHGNWEPLLYLLPLSFAATGLGLLISAIVGRNRQLAAAILPLVMMVQIVFSAQVRSGDDSLEEAYKDLHFRRCTGKVCQERADSPTAVPPSGDDTTQDSELSPPVRCQRFAEEVAWSVGEGRWRWRCEDCAFELSKDNERRQTTASDPVGEMSAGQSKADVLCRVIEPADEADALKRQRETRPRAVTVAMMYLTLSRYGDITLRSFCYTKGDYEDYEEARTKADSRGSQLARWRRDALAILILASLGLPALAGGVLVLQTGEGFRQLATKAGRLLSQRV